MSDARLPTHVLVDGLRRLVTSEGGFATVLSKGDRDSGSVILLLRSRDGAAKLVERRPSASAGMVWEVTENEPSEKVKKIYEICEKRASFDPDLWVLEADIADPARLVALLPQ